MLGSFWIFSEDRLINPIVQLNSQRSGTQQSLNIKIKSVPYQVINGKLQKIINFFNQYAKII